MATEQASERRSAHIRGVTVTSLASLAGIAAAFASAVLLGNTAAAAKDQVGLGILGASILVQLPILRVLGIDVEDFSAKDYIYVVFMTFVLWFITWTILLTNNVAL